MTSNGRRRPRRPRIDLVAPGAGPAETAAIAAALERFLHDTAPAPGTRSPSADSWERAALAQGVGLEPPTPWGDGEPWGS